jgi:hypothetical protein
MLLPFVEVQAERKDYNVGVCVSACVCGYVCVLCPSFCSSRGFNVWQF